MVGHQCLRRHGDVQCAERSNDWSLQSAKIRHFKWRLVYVAAFKAAKTTGESVASEMGVSEFLCKRVGLQLTEMRSLFIRVAILFFDGDFFQGLSFSVQQFPKV